MDAPTREGRCIFYVCCGSISCERVHTPTIGHRNGTQTASEDATGIEHHRAQDSAPQRAKNVIYKVYKTY